MIAIPVMRGRVAPVMNWCSRIMIFPAAPEGGTGQELWVTDLGAWERLRLLQAEGVKTLICGALSADLQHGALQLGFKVFPGVAGEVEAVLQAFRQDRLDRPEFWMPGCRGTRRYRQNLGNEDCPALSEDEGGQEIMPRGTSGRGPGGGGQAGRCRGGRSGAGRQGAGGGAGMADVCVCPACGAQTPHERGIPCLQLNCPQCGKPMVRG